MQEKESENKSKGNAFRVNENTVGSSTGKATKPKLDNNGKKEKEKGGGNAFEVNENTK